MTGMGIGAFLVGRSAATAGAASRIATPAKKRFLIATPWSPSAHRTCESTPRFQNRLCPFGHSAVEKGRHSSVTGSPRSCLRDAGRAHPLDDPRALGEKDGVVALRAAAESLEGEALRQREAGLDFRLGLFLLAEVRERRRIVEMVERIIAAGVDRLAEETRGLLVLAKMELREALDMAPQEGDAVTR